MLVVMTFRYRRTGMCRYIKLNLCKSHGSVRWLSSRSRCQKTPNVVRLWIQTGVSGDVFVHILLSLVLIMPPYRGMARLSCQTEASYAPTVPIAIYPSTNWAECIVTNVLPLN